MDDTLTKPRKNSSPHDVGLRDTPKLVSFVIPVYNEEAVFPLLRERLVSVAEAMQLPAEWVIVNDGSCDATESLLFDWAAQDTRVKAVSFARNFGHQVAVTAGLDHAAGDVVIMLDGDLQDPPELALQMIEKFRLGYDVVFGKRLSRQKETWFKRLTASLFYKVMQVMMRPRLEINPGDFCLLSRAALNALMSMRESHRFLRGMIAWIGFPRSSVEFIRPGRAAGETKYPFRKMFAFATDAILSFSALPLKLATMVGVTTSFLGLAYGLYSIAQHLRGQTLSGWTSLIVLTCILDGAVLLSVGLVGEYVGRLFEDGKQRPLYIVRQSANLMNQPTPQRAVSPAAYQSESPQRLGA